MENQESSKNNSSKTSFDDLPSETTVNIFSRLPVKTLVQSTSVSKSWYSLITDPHFITAHLQHSLSSVNNETAVLVIPMDKVMQEKYASLVCADTGHVFGLHEIPFKTRSNSLQLVGSVDGLLCLTDANVPFVWLMKREAGIVSWTLGFKVDFQIEAEPLCISKSGTMLMVVMNPFCQIAAVVSSNIQSMFYKNLGFHQQLDMRIVRPPSCDTSFVESLVMLDGGNALLKSKK